MSGEPPLVLYGPSQAPFTEKVRRGLLLKGLDFEFRQPTDPEDYKRWSPETGLLPVLTIGDEIVSDSTRILKRLDELKPTPALLSRDHVVAQQQRQLEEWADESFLWYFTRWVALRGDARLPTLRATLTTTEEERPTEPQSSLVRRLRAWLGAGGTWERPEAGLLRGISDRLGDLANFLGTRPFFYADEPSMADLAVYGMLFTMRADAIPGSERLLGQRPSLQEFMKRVERATGDS